MLNYDMAVNVSFEDMLNYDMAVDMVFELIKILR